MFTLNIHQRKYVYPALTLLLLFLFLMRYAMAADTVIPAPKKTAGEVVDSAIDSAKDVARKTERGLDRAVDSVGSAIGSAEDSTRDAVNRTRADFRGVNNKLRETRATTPDTAIMRSNASSNSMTSGTAADLAAQVRAREEQLSSQAVTQQQWIDGYNTRPYNAYENDEALIRRDVANIMPEGYTGGPSASELRSEQRADVRYAEERVKLNEERMKSQRDYRQKREGLQKRLSGLASDSAEYKRIERELSDLDRGHVEAEKKLESAYRNMDAKFSGNNW